VTTPTPLTTASVLNVTPPAYIPAEGLEVLGLINAWRVGLDLWPLAPNSQLSTLAQAQADYLGSLDTWPENIHEDAQGGVSDDRARAAGWPAYDDTGEAVAVTEIIATGQSPQAAVEWWRGSEIHSWVVSQPYYREAGVGVIEREFSTTYVVVVGSRPNMLPAMYDPVRGELYLTDELFSGGYDGILWDAQRVQFLPGVGATPAASGWLPHAVRFDVAPPPGAVIYEGATTRVTMPVDRIAWLPHVVAAVER
jgi:uncharacterized protein YkwD